MLMYLMSVCGWPSGYDFEGPQLLHVRPRHRMRAPLEVLTYSRRKRCMVGCGMSKPDTLKAHDALPDLNA
jgi:hypothetical protein